MVSVIIPFYNCEKTLVTCLDSVLAQEYGDLEAVCVDDGSSDGTWPLLMGVSLRDKRVRVFRQENKGPGEARNRGIAEAKGDFITFLDGDDSLSPYTIGALVRESEGADVVMGGFTSINAGHPMHPAAVCAPDKFKGSIEDYSKSRLMGMLKDDSVYLIGSKLYRSALIKENALAFDSEYRICEDALFSVSALSCAKNVAVIPEAGYFYISREGQSLSSGYDPKGIPANSELYSKICENFGEWLDKKELDAYFAKRYIGLLLRIYSMSEFRGEARYTELERVLQDPVLKQVLSEADPGRVEGLSFRFGAHLLKREQYRAFHRMCCIRYKQNNKREG